MSKPKAILACNAGDLSRMLVNGHLKIDIENGDISRIIMLEDKSGYICGWRINLVSQEDILKQIEKSHFEFGGISGEDCKNKNTALVSYNDVLHNDIFVLDYETIIKYNVSLLRRFIPIGESSKNEKYRLHNYNKETIKLIDKPKYEEFGIILLKEISLEKKCFHAIDTRKILNKFFKHSDSMELEIEHFITYVLLKATNGEKTITVKHVLC